MKWLFLSEKFNTFSGKETETLTWEQKTKFSGQIGDEVLMLDKEHRFTYTYKIQEADFKAPTNGGSFYGITLQLKQLSRYEEEKELLDYAFSFPRVRNFGTRINRHFNRRYYRLTEIEFDAVNNDDIFVERSLVGTVINAMHKDHQQEFVKFLVEEYPAIIQGKIGYGNIARKLLEYINFAIITPACQLQEAGVVLKGLLDDNIYSVVSFDGTEDRRPLRPSFIAAQVKLIIEYVPILQTMTKYMPNPYERIQNKFSKAFEGKGLPINLN